MKKNVFNALRRICAVALAVIALFTCTSFASADLDGGLSSGGTVASLSEVGASGAYLQDGIYFIACYCDISMVLNVQYRNVSSGMVLDSNNYEDNELWILTNVGDGNYFTLSPVFASDYYLAGQLNDAQLRLAKGASSFNNQWKAVLESDGHYVLVNRNSGLAIDSAHGQSNTGNPVLNYYKNGYREAQSWTLGRVSEFTNRQNPGTVTTVSNGLYAFLLKTDQNKCLNVQYNVKVGNGTARMCVDSYNGQENEQFYVTYRGNNCYTISPKSAPNTCVNVWAANPIAGSQLTLATYQDGDQCSLWIPYKNSDGSISWMNAKTHLFMNDYYNRTNDGNPIVTYYFDDTDAGRWVMKSVSGVSYAAYTGVNYRSQTTDSRRIAVCDKAVQMATILWTAPCDFPTWKGSDGIYNTVTATDGTSAKKFVSGKTYQGIPYSMASRIYDDTKWAQLVQNGLTTSMMSGTYTYKNVTRTNTTAKGIDCSYLVCTALNAGCGGALDASSLNTTTMLRSSQFKKISRSQMLPGDVFLKDGHTMLFIGKTSSGYYAVIEANADYSRVVYRELPLSSVSGYGCYRYAGF